MNPVFEYIAAIFIMTLVVGYSLYSLNTMSSAQLNIAEQAQLQPEVGRLYDKILLTKGYPEDWGSNIYINNSNLADFGISSEYGGMYRTDVNKLMRLVNNLSYTVNPFYIHPTTMGNLTGIYEDAGWSYGFRLRMADALKLNITYDQDQEPVTSYRVSVTNYWDRHASNAVVKGLYFLVWVDKHGNEDVFEYSYTTAENETDWQGQTVLDFTGRVPTVPQGVQKYGYILFSSANYYGIQSQKIQVIGGPIQTINLFLQGDYLIANYSEIEGVAKGAYHLELAVIEFTSNQQVIVDPALNETEGAAGKVVNSGGKDYAVFHLQNPVSEDIVFAGILVKKTGQWTLAFCSRPTAFEIIDYRSHSFAYAGINSQTYSRLVRVGPNSYYAELTVWRTSQ